MPRATGQDATTRRAPCPVLDIWSNRKEGFRGVAIMLSLVTGSRPANIAHRAPDARSDVCAGNRETTVRPAHSLCAARSHRRCRIHLAAKPKAAGSQVADRPERPVAHCVSAAALPALRCRHWRCTGRSDAGWRGHLRRPRFRPLLTDRAARRRRGRLARRSAAPCPAFARGRQWPTDCRACAGHRAHSDAARGRIHRSAVRACCRRRVAWRASRRHGLEPAARPRRANPVAASVSSCNALELHFELLIAVLKLFDRARELAQRSFHAVEPDGKVARIRLRDPARRCRLARLGRLARLAGHSPRLNKLSRKLPEPR